MVARMAADAEAQFIRIPVKGRWPLLLAVPEKDLPTEQARKVLPTQYSRADAVSNVQNSMLLLAAFTCGRQDLLGPALEDRFHQPYRAALCPLLPALQNMGKPAGLLGVALSGAGPSVLMFLDGRARVNQVVTAVKSHLRAQGLAAELIRTAIEEKGAAQGRNWQKAHTRLVRPRA